MATTEDRADHLLAFSPSHEACSQRVHQSGHKHESKRHRSGQIHSVVNPLSAELRCTNIGRYQCPGRRPRGCTKTKGSIRLSTFTRWADREARESRSCPPSVCRGNFDLRACLLATKTATTLLQIRSQAQLLVQVTPMPRLCPTELLLRLQRREEAQANPVRLRPCSRGFPR